MTSQPNLKPLQTPGAGVQLLDAAHWRLSIPAGPGGRYRLAQLDDYASRARSNFPWRPPLRLSLRARASATKLPGTWGFGFWNDPFSLSLGLGGGARRFPALPNAAWYFFASAQNYLSFRRDLPANGALMAGFAAPRLPAPLLALGSLGLPLFYLPGISQLLRRLVQLFVKEDAARLEFDPTAWHEYSLEWTAAGLHWQVDGQSLLRSSLQPRPPLGLVIWLDNQFAALPPGGGLRFGFLPNPEPAWMEIDHLKCRYHFNKRGLGCFGRAKPAQNTPLPPAF